MTITPFQKDQTQPSLRSFPCLAANEASNEVNQCERPLLQAMCQGGEAASFGRSGVRRISCVKRHLRAAAKMAIAAIASGRHRRVPAFKAREAERLGRTHRGWPRAIRREMTKNAQRIIVESGDGWELPGCGFPARPPAPERGRFPPRKAYSPDSEGTRGCGILLC
jgi:hypothetical protein